MLFNLALHLVPGALHLKLIHAELDIGQAVVVRLASSLRANCNSAILQTIRILLGLTHHDR